MTCVGCGAYPHPAARPWPVLPGLPIEAEGFYPDRVSLGHSPCVNGNIRAGRVNRKLHG